MIRTYLTEMAWPTHMWLSQGAPGRGWPRGAQRPVGPAGRARPSPHRLGGAKSRTGSECLKDVIHWQIVATPSSGSLANRCNPLVRRS